MRNELDEAVCDLIRHTVELLRLYKAKVIFKLVGILTKCL
jgi:hypothetical protein